ncbi:hypothetical protein AADC60_10590 [Cytobacillus pseudoceanisediminis]|uniref:Uncharacterized protein n=1 Tax=Cytobacillus pseudoceanisediminis TaxID=3051614 RepID=A0ABZ2ZN59_9BACI
MEKKVRPHCHVCMKEMKMGQEVVMDGAFKGIIHANCNYLTAIEIEDKGLFEEVIGRNPRWFKQFNHLISH